MIPKTDLPSVPDTNLVLAAHLRANAKSPNAEFFGRWQAGELTLLFSEDTLLEYIEKLNAKGIPGDIVIGFTRAILELGEEVHIEFFHLAAYPIDMDDVAFLLCAVNGEASHLVSYDRHLLEMDGGYSFKICKPLQFLQDLRRALAQEQPSG